MSDVLPSKKFLQLIKVLLDVSTSVVREFAKYKVYTEYSNSFIKFLDLNKHKLYHKWKNNTPCCRCDNFKNIPKEMTEKKFCMLYQIISDREIKCINGKGIIRKNGCMKQYCICNIIPQQIITLDDMDISMLSLLLLNSDLTDSQIKYIDKIREMRNSLCHARSTSSFPDNIMDKIKTILFHSTRELAKDVNQEYCTSIDKQLDKIISTDVTMEEIERLHSMELERMKMQDSNQEVEVTVISRPRLVAMVYAIRDQARKTMAINATHDDNSAKVDFIAPRNQERKSEDNIKVIQETSDLNSFLGTLSENKVYKSPVQFCYNLCKTHLAIDANTFKCEEFGRPTTNYVYKCSWNSTGQEPSQVLVRMYGEIAEEPFPTFLIKKLLVIHILAERNMGPKCYGYNEEGRIEELYTCVHVERSQPEDLCLYYELVARKIAEMHTQDMPLTKKPTFLFDFCTPRISNIKNWLLTVVISEDAVKTIHSFDFKQNLWDVIRATADLKSEVVFSHNGLTKGDVLQLTEETDLQLPSLKLVDFEYSAYNYRAFDLSMLFIECCIEYRNKDTLPYFDFNSEYYFPPEIRKQICREYLIARSNTGVATYREVNRLFHETEICELAVHLVWTIWGVDQHIRRETILFGYLEYAVAHLEEYTKKMKDLKDRELI